MIVQRGNKNVSRKNKLNIFTGLRLKLNLYSLEIDISRWQQNQKLIFSKIWISAVLKMFLDFQEISGWFSYELGSGIQSLIK